MEEIKNKIQDRTLSNSSLLSNDYIPDTWNIVKLGEVAEYINGKAFKSSEWAKEGVPIIRIQNLNREISEYNYCKVEIEKKYHVNFGDLLFAWSGTPDTSFGAHIWRGGFAYLNQHIFRIVVNEKLIDRQFYLYALKNKIKEFVKKAHGTAGLAHITKSKFEAAKIPLPPIAEQQRIVSKIEVLFSELDKGIENLKTAQKQLKVYRQSVLKSAFEGKLTEEWRKKHLNQIASEDITEEKNSSLGELPSGWKWVKLGDVLRSKLTNGYSGKPVKYFTNYKVLKLSATTSGKFSSKYYKYLDEKNLYDRDIWCSNHDILIQRGNTLEYVGVPALYEGKDKEFIFPDLMFRVQCSENLIIPKYLYYNISNQYQRDYLRKRVAGSAGTMPKINQNILSSLPISLPTLSEQQAIVQEIESRFSICDKLEETIQSSLKQAESLRQSILKKAFEGKLVAQDPNDEPASVLLERIRAEKNTTFEKTNVNSARKVAENALSPKDNLIQFPQLIPEITTTDLHAGVIAMVIEAHEKQPKYLEHLGHVKCEKIAHLVESHLGISLGRMPVKDAAGPDDYPHLKKVESRAIKANYFGIKKLNIGHTYQSKQGMHKVLTKVSNQLDSNDLQKIRNLIQDFMPLDKLRSEVVATLFAAWNNLLIGGKQPTNEEIIFEARENWTPEKLKIPRENFLKTLLWMRRKGYIPEGKGAIVPKSSKKTSTQKGKKGSRE